jgi:hypothetical protein
MDLKRTEPAIKNRRVNIEQGGNLMGIAWPAKLPADKLYPSYSPAFYLSGIRHPVIGIQDHFYSTALMGRSTSIDG